MSPQLKEKISKLNVLIVDDDLIMRNLIASVLSEIGIINCSFATNGLVALKRLKQLNSSFDLIICDWMMPEMDGLEFLKQLRANNYQTCFVMLTAKKEKTDILDAKDEGVDAYIAKPFTPLQLHDKIKALVRKIAIG